MKLFAYIDPGTGSVVLQAIIGGIVGGGYIVRKQIGTLIARFRGRPAMKPDEHVD